MKVICVLLDSLNRHFLPAYGNDWVQTPNIDAFRQRSVKFNQHYIGSAPCMPARRDLWTGDWEFLWRPWGSLEPWDQPLPYQIGAADITAQLVTDHYHLFETGGENYHCGFHGWDLIRGHENDPWITAPCDPMPEHHGILTERYWKNMSRFRKEEEYLAPRTMTAAANWLKENHGHEDFFLMIDEFDPHEPFHVPEPYDTMYDDEWDGPLYFWEWYGRSDEESEAAMKHIRAQYAGKVTMVDKWLGRLFDQMDKHNLWDDTMVIVTTDHGHFLGEHGWMGKPPCPAYQTISHIPLMIHMPGGKRAGEEVDALSTTVDLYATILDAFGIQPARPVQGRSLLPVLEGKADKVRDWCLYGWWGQSVNLVDGTHTYLRAPQKEDNLPLEMHSMRWSTAPWWRLPDLTGRLEFGPFMPQTEMDVGRMSIQPGEAERMHARLKDVVRDPLLFDIRTDEDQENDLAGTDLEKGYVEKLREALKEVQAPESQFERLGL